MHASPEDLKDALLKLCEPILEEKGIELVDLDVVIGKKRTVLRFFLDGLETHGSITISDCSKMSRELEDALEFEEIMQSPYVLEVSSPGVDRPLVKEAHFTRFAGNKVQITTHGGAEGRHRYSGMLHGVQNHLIVLENDQGEELRIPFASIKKANIKYEWKK